MQAKDDVGIPILDLTDEALQALLKEEASILQDLDIIFTEEGWPTNGYES